MDTKRNARGLLDLGRSFIPVPHNLFFYSVSICLCPQCVRIVGFYSDGSTADPFVILNPFFLVDSLHLGQIDSGCNKP